MKKTNYKEIARIARVSQASVTRFFNKTSNVSSEIESKITQAIKTLRVTLPVEKVIGIIIPDNENPYFTSVAFEFEKEFERLGWHLLISNSEGKLSKDLKIIERFKGLGISGLIYINSGNQSEELYSMLIANHHDLPVLSFDRILESRYFDYLVVDSKLGTSLSVDFLVSKGHKKIAYLKGLKGTLPAANRYEAFLEAMSSNGLSVEKKWCFEGNFQLDSGYDCGTLLTAMPEKDRPSAIICGNDLMAIGLINKLQNAGWKLPSQLSIIGFDDIPVSKWIYPSLTTIAQPIRIMVSNAAEMILKRIESQKEGLQIPQQNKIITPSMVIRNSVTEPFNSKKHKHS